MPVRLIRTREELVAALECQLGFLYNDFGASSPEMCVLHQVSCRWISRMLAVQPGRLSVRKVWSADLNELLRWTRENGKPHRFCASCNPAGTAGEPTLEPVNAGAEPRRSSFRSAAGAPRRGFHVRGPDDATSTVEVWSESRLPFEPKGDMLLLREAIRSAIRSMRPAEDQIFGGLYVSPIAESCDAENVLFYNVGDASFAHLSRSGLSFERSFDRVPSSDSHLDFTPSHYHRYGSVSARSPWRHWTPGSLIAECEALLPGSNTAPEHVWWAVKSGTLTRAQDQQDSSGHSD